MSTPAAIDFRLLIEELLGSAVASRPARPYPAAGAFGERRPTGVSGEGPCGAMTSARRPGSAPLLGDGALGTSEERGATVTASGPDGDGKQTSRTRDNSGGKGGAMTLAEALAAAETAAPEAGRDPVTP